MKVEKRIVGGGWALASVLGGLVLLSVGSSPRRAMRQEIPPEIRKVVEGNSKFALALFSRLKSPHGNQVFSPLSVSSAMAMAYAGARGKTEQQMARALHFPPEQTSTHSCMGGLLTSLNNIGSAGDVELQVANGLWPDRNYQFAAEFLNLCRRHYRAEPDFVDFKGNSESARQRVNSWMERSTRGKIRQVFAPGSVNPETRLVLANAMYFKGKWASRFDRAKTRPRPFWVTPERTEQVPMMSQQSTFLHSTEGDVQILELPYQGKGISMLVILPKARDGLAGLEAQLTLENLERWITRLRPAHVDLRLPRFQVRSKFSLSQTLTGMGMPDAFDEARADFTGMTAQQPLFLSLVEHSAVVETDEEGTVAAAATGVAFGCAQSPRPATFHADHPFLFLMADRSTQSLLLIGRITNPGR